jgi:hypothetical protein
MWNIWREIQLHAMLTQGITMVFVRPLALFNFFQKGVYFAEIKIFSSLHISFKRTINEKDYF